MLTLGRLVVRFRYAILLTWVAAVAVAIPAARRVGERLRVDIPSAAGNESTRAHALIDSVFPNPAGSGLAVVITAPSSADGAAFSELVVAIHDAVARFRIVREVVTPELTAPADGSRKALLLALARPGAADDLTEQVAPLRAALARAMAGRPLAAVADVAVTGEPALEYDAQQVAVGDARRFERWALLPAGLVLLAAFGSLVAAALPLVMGVAAITCALALLALVGASFPLAVYVLPIVSMVGLGVGIDYSLLLISRFREEMRVDGHAAAAARRAVATAGRAVVVSGTTVVIGFAALLLAPSWEIRSVGVGGLLVVASAVALAATLLPALLAILGKGLDWPTALARAREARDKSPAVGPAGRVSERLPSARSGSIRELQRPQGPTARLVPSFPVQRAPSTAFWKHWGGAITRYRWAALVGGLAIALLLAWPLTSLRIGMPVQGWFPTGTESARGADALAGMGFGGELLPIDVVLRAPAGQRVVDAAHLGLLQRLTDSLANDPRVARVRGPVSLLPGTSRLGYAMLYSDLAQARRRHPEIFESYVAPDGRAARFDVVLADTASMQTGMEVARDARALLARGMPGLSTDAALVGGFFAAQLDTLNELSRAFPLMLVLVLGVTAVMLLIAFRSVIVPLKAVILNALSLAAAFGLVVWVFQQGHGASLLGLAGGTERTFVHVPVLVFAIAFGLSMDYEVFLLSRMKEAFDRSGDNDAATSAGLAATATLITSAAAIMVVVFGTFAFSRLLIAQVLGFGLAAAVLIDATVVRLVIVPAFMHVAGKWNWWPGGGGGTAERRNGGPTDRGRGHVARVANRPNDSGAEVLREASFRRSAVPPFRRSVLLSIHDVTPAHAAALDRVFEMLEPLVGGRMALLVVPDWHGAWPLDRHPAFVERLHELVTAGAEIVLHGYRHDEAGRQRSLVDRLRVFGRTAASAEFMFLSRDETAARIDCGLDLFAKLGFQPVGFVPPAWLFGPHTREVLRERSLSITETFWQLSDLATGVSCWSPVFSWSTARPWRSRLTATLASARVAVEQGRALTRVAIHPPDATIPVVARSVESTLERLLAGREAVGYVTALG